MSKELPQPQQSEEVDLGQLFKLIGNMFDKLFKFIGSVFNKLFLAFIWLVFFVKKHFVKLVIAGVIGVFYGFFTQKNSVPTYMSYILVQQNYDTGESLYNSIKYYDDLVEQKDVKTLCKVLDIDSLNAVSITEFDIESVIDENNRLKNYDSYLKELDSVLASTILYSTYLKNEKDFNHKIQQITIKATERSNFKVVFDRIVDNINRNEYFVREQQKDITELKNRKRTLEEALVESDSLKNTYKRVLEMKEREGASQTNVTIKNADDVNKTREFDLYKNDLDLEREIVDLEREIEDKKVILEVISSKKETGAIDNKKYFFGLRVGYKAYYSVFLIFGAFIVLIGIEFIKFLEQFKDKI